MSTVWDLGGVEEKQMGIERCGNWDGEGMVKHTKGSDKVHSGSYTTGDDLPESNKRPVNDNVPS